MTFTEYKVDASRTCPDLGNLLTNNIHMTMGMITEIGEMYDATDTTNALEEIGDFFWYFANFCRINNINYGEKLTSLPEARASIQEIDVFIITADLVDIYKKALAYGKPVDDEIVSKLVWKLGPKLLEATAKTINFEEKTKNLTLSDILEANINKLRLHFPEKFDQNLAINRNHAAERIQLEKDL